MEILNNDLINKGYGSSIDFARLLRKYSTAAEHILWQFLRNRQQNGWKFRRQHPLKGYIVDFYCHQLKLVIEVDGEIHHVLENKLYDELRTRSLNESGLQVIRFTNDEVLTNLGWVLEKINSVKKHQLSARWKRKR